MPQPDDLEPVELVLNPDQAPLLLRAISVAYASAHLNPSERRSLVPIEQDLRQGLWEDP